MSLAPRCGRGDSSLPKLSQNRRRGARRRRRRWHGSGTSSFTPETRPRVLARARAPAVPRPRYHLAWWSHPCCVDGCDWLIGCRVKSLCWPTPPQDAAVLGGCQVGRAPERAARGGGRLRGAQGEDGRQRAPDAAAERAGGAGEYRVDRDRREHRRRGQHRVCVSALRRAAARREGRAAESK